MLKPIFVLIFFLCLTCRCFAQIDTVFWFAAPDVSSGLSLDRPVFLRFTTFGQAAVVTVTQPANMNFPAQVLNIPANGTQSIDITTWIDDIESFPADAVLNKGIKITATALVTAYYEVVSGNFGANAPNNPEAFVLKGRNALGTDFWIPSQNMVSNDNMYQPAPYNAFDIVATSDNTDVTITPSRAITGHPANIPFTITLQTGQSYSAVAAGYLNTQHLCGSRVTASRPVAITVTDDLIGGAPYSGCADLTGDQIVPVGLAGKEYIAIKGLLGNVGDYLFITATENNTGIYIDNAGPVTNINAGQTYATPVSGATAYVKASNPVYVWQLSGSGCELGAAILPAILCTGSNRVSYVRSSGFELYINLLVESGGQNSFTINGNPVSSTLFNNVNSTAGAWLYARILLPVAQYPQGSIINVSNDGYKFHLSTIDINGGGTSYGYFSNYGAALANVTAFPNPLCAGDTIRFNSNEVAGGQYTWTGPSGFMSHDRNPVINSVAVSDSGMYVLEAGSDNCMAKDSVHVIVYPVPDVRILNNDTAICSGVAIQLQTQGQNVSQYHWVPGSYLSNPDSANTTSTPLQSIAYFVTGSNEGGCRDMDSVLITVYPNPVLTLYADDTVLSCSHPVTQLHVSGAETYYWSPESLCDDRRSEAPVVYPQRSTTFSVTGTNAFGCSSQDSLVIDYAAKGVLFVPNAFSPNGDGHNDHFYPFLYCDMEFSRFFVYNRWGEQVFFTNKQGDGWDGNFQGRYADMGVYFWYFEGKDESGTPVSRKGDVMLIR